MVRYGTGPALAKTFAKASKWLEALYPTEDADAVPDPVDTPIRFSRCPPAETDEEAVVAIASANPLEALEHWQANMQFSPALSDKTPSASGVANDRLADHALPEDSPKLSALEESAAPFASLAQPEVVETQTPFSSLSPAFSSVLPNASAGHAQTVEECASGWLLDGAPLAQSEPPSELVRLVFAEWSELHRRAHDYKAAALSEARQRGMRQKVLSFWMCEVEVDSSMLKAMLHGWSEITMVERVRRSDKRTLQRLQFSPDVSGIIVSTPVLNSPKPMQRAVGALLADTGEGMSAVFSSPGRNATKRQSAASKLQSGLWNEWQCLRLAVSSKRCSILGVGCLRRTDYQLGLSSFSKTCAS
jgi:hypothetical protein